MNAILTGDLDPSIEAYLLPKINNKQKIGKISGDFP